MAPPFIPIIIRPVGTQSRDFPLFRCLFYTQHLLLNISILNQCAQGWQQWFQWWQPLSSLHGQCHMSLSTQMPQFKVFLSLGLTCSTFRKSSLARTLSPFLILHRISLISQTGQKKINFQKFLEEMNFPLAADSTDCKLLGGKLRKPSFLPGAHCHHSLEKADLII